MKYRQLPNTDLNVSVLSLGTATFGGSYGFEGWGHVDTAEATRMIDIALEAGINMFDTADVYSQGWSDQIARLDQASAQPKAYPYWHQNLKPEFKSQIFY